MFWKFSKFSFINSYNAAVLKVLVIGIEMPTSTVLPYLWEVEKLVVFHLAVVVAAKLSLTNNVATMSGNLDM